MNGGGSSRRLPPRTAPAASLFKRGRACLGWRRGKSSPPNRRSRASEAGRRVGPGKRADSRVSPRGWLGVKASSARMKLSGPFRTTARCVQRRSGRQKHPRDCAHLARQPVRRRVGRRHCARSSHSPPRPRKKIRPCRPCRLPHENQANK